MIPYFIHVFAVHQFHIVFRSILLYGWISNHSSATHFKIAVPDYLQRQRTFIGTHHPSNQVDDADSTPINTRKFIR